VEDIVAVRVALDSGASRYFITWGRVFDSVDPTWTEELVLDASRRFSLGGEPLSAEMCWSLRDARDETYFYEAVAEYAARLAARPTDPDERRAWLAERARDLEAGNGIYYLGLPHD
jgi:hypothetical protein